MNWKRNLNLYGLQDKVIISLIILVFLSTFAEIIGIGMFLPVFEFIEIQQNVNENINPEGILHYINNILLKFGIESSLEIILIIMFSMFFLSKSILFIVSYVKAYYLGKMARDMRNNLLKKYLSANSNYYDRVDIGSFVNNNISELGSAVTGVMAPINIIVTFFSAVGSFLLLFILSYELTFISIIVISVSILYPYRWVKATTEVGKKNSLFNSKTTSFLLGRLRSPRLVRLSSTANHEADEYSKLTEKQRQLTLAVHMLKAKVLLVLEPLVIGISLAMLYFSMNVLKLEMSVVVLFMAVMVRMVPIINNLVSQFQGYNKTKGPILFINNLIDDLDSNIDSNMFTKHSFEKVREDIDKLSNKRK